MRLQPHIQRFLRQGPDSPTEINETLARIAAIANEEMTDAAAA
jgi:hypothetical protein